MANKPPKTNPLTAARKTTIRASLAAGSVLATLFGAQSLLGLDQRVFTGPPVSPQATSTTSHVISANIPAAPPQVVIMRNPGTGQVVSVQPSGIKPPVPVIAPPAPQVISGSPAIVQAAPVQPAPVSNPSR